MDDEKQRRGGHLDKLDRLIADCAARIERQAQRAASLKRLGLVSAKIAEDTLEAMRLELSSLQATRATIDGAARRLV